MEMKPTFEQLYEQYYTPILRYIVKRISSYQDAEDIAANVFVTAYRNYEGFDPTKASAATWLYMICSSRLKNYYRDKKENVSLDDEENPVDVSSGELIEDAVLMEERSRMLHDAISKLPERQQQAVRMKYFRNMSAADIAAELGTTAGNVRVILNRSMDKQRIPCGLLCLSDGGISIWHKYSEKAPWKSFPPRSSSTRQW